MAMQRFLLAKTCRQRSKNDVLLRYAGDVLLLATKLSL